MIPLFEYDATKERMTADEAANQTTRLLREQLAYCKRHSPYYRRLLAGVDVTQFTPARLVELPFTDKHILSEHAAEFQAAPMREIEDIVFSSGTTGIPTRIAYSRSDMARLAYNEHRSFAAAGMTPDDIVLLTCTMDRCFVAGLAYYLGVRSIGAVAVRNGLNTIESHAEVIRRLKPTILVGVPSFLRNLGNAMREQEIDISSVRKLLCIGEPVRDREYKISGLGEQIQELWNAEVHSTYASSEIVTSFCECEARRGGHLLEDLAVAEIVDESGNILADGEVGELTLTQLQCTGMPLIRFRTGDMTFLTHEPCECGRVSPRIGPILGRKAHMLKCKGTTLYPQAIFAVLDVEPEVLEYYVEADGSALSDSVSAVVALRTPGADLESVARRLQAKCRIQIPVRERPLDEVRAQVFHQSRKPVRFFDLRSR